MRAAIAIVALSCLGATSDAPAAKDTLALRGKPQALHLYGVRGNPAAIVASGDGGWMHVGPAVAKFLAARGYFVVGFDSKDYLTAFTDGNSSLKQEDVPGDFRTLVEYAARGASGKPVLIGVSEGGALCVLAATDSAVKQRVRGVLGLGLCDRNELAWRFRDSIIYFTHKVPNEPTFSVAAIIGRVAPLPMAAIHSTHDAFVPLEDAKGLLARAGEPNRLWIIDAQNHNFEGNVEGLQRGIVEALQWIDAHSMQTP
jgi:type IV secretory pathway VirJ component